MKWYPLNNCSCFIYCCSKWGSEKDCHNRRKAEYHLVPVARQIIVPYLHKNDEQMNDILFDTLPMVISCLHTITAYVSILFITTQFQLSGKFFIYCITPIHIVILYCGIYTYVPLILLQNLLEYHWHPFLHEW